MTTQGQKVAIGLSGGVDSAVAAALLVEQGLDVTGVFLECWPPDAKAMGGKCRADEDRKDALAVALKLGIPFKVLDFKKAYKQKVVGYFYDEYKAGRTPNPDVMCNKEIKFGLFYDWALRRAQGKPGFDYVATGHDAKISHHSFQDTESYLGNQASLVLCMPKDRQKDQSYFLYRLRPEQLGHILFPLGNLTKVQVRAEARERGLSVADKPDSQGICFIGEVNIKKFLRERLAVKIGKVVDTKGQVIGEHDGVWFYTIGQRHGFRISNKLQVTSNKYDIPPMYVVEKDVKHNQLMVGFGPETYRSQFEVTDLSWLDSRWQILDDRKGSVRIRHGGSLIKSRIQHLKSRILVKLGEPQRGIAPGQSAVFYQGEVVLGGGVIS
ncbi:MAG: tRNA 2-thiouridine(34) synthase MnmA [Candidatus Chisholmbacteria bacterium]|nr:tRNA 2-thiouridine(34) synthase MnmA [Candidatus Chisholmbacteria bacterium]